MANLAQGRSSDPQILTLAFDISSTQTNQAGRMQAWLDLWGLPPSSGRPAMSWMGDMHATSVIAAAAAGGGVDMPGMAGEEELRALRESTGTAFDTQFLRLMISHHQGALPMARHAAAQAEVETVRALARSIADAQNAETTTMTRLLTGRGGAPLPAP